LSIRKGETAADLNCGTAATRDGDKKGKVRQAKAGHRRLPIPGKIVIRLKISWKA
jgi:hypothetical protein